MGKKQSAPEDTTGKQMTKAAKRAKIAAIESREYSEKAGRKAFRSAQGIVKQIGTATGKSPAEYATEAEKQYTSIVPAVRQEFEQKLAAFNPEQQLRPYSTTAQAGLRESANVMGQRVASDVERFGGMIAEGATAAGEELSRFSRQAARQQAQAFRTFEESARGATELGAQTAFAMSRGLSNLYNPEYQELMEGARSGASTRKSSLLDEIRAKSLYNV